MIRSFLGRKPLPTVDARAALDAVYARIPKIACKRLCQSFCGPVPMTRVEGDRAAELRPLAPVQTGLRCVHLDAAGGCDIYAVRPAVCRLFGVVDHPLMTCPHGCVPERVLTQAVAKEIVREIERLGA